MAGIGEASAVLAFVELGFSFGSALAKYTKDYQKAAAEIGGLPEKIEETIGLISDLQELLVQNETTHCWTDAGVKRAYQNVKDCQQILNALQNLLLKAGIPPDKADITLEDLELSVVTKATWPLKYKPKVEDAKENLDKLYNRISVTILTYSVQTSKERTSRAGLEKELARLLYQETKGHKKDKGKQRQDTKQSQASVKPAIPNTGMQKPKHRACRASRARSKSPVADDSDGDDRTRIEAICAALKDLARAEIARETEKKQAEEKRTEAMRALAVDEWQTNIGKQVEEQNRRRDNLRQELSPRLEDSAIEEVLKSVFPPESGLDQRSRQLLAAISDVPNAPSQQRLGVASPAQKQSKPILGGLFGRKKVRQPELDGELREMVSPAGRASLRGFTIAYDSERFVHSIQMGAPQQIFLERLLSRSERRSTKSKGESTPWQEYAMLPAVFKSKIAKERKSLGDAWLLVHVERVFEPVAKKMFKRPPQLLRGVYVIFRYQASGLKPEKDPKVKIHQHQDDGDKVPSIASGAANHIRPRNEDIPAPTGLPEPSFEQRVADALHGRSRSHRPPTPEGPTPYGKPIVYSTRQRNPSAPPEMVMGNPSMTRGRRGYDTSPARPSRYSTYFDDFPRAAQSVQIVKRERPHRSLKAYRQGRTVDLDAVRRDYPGHGASLYDTTYDDREAQRGRSRRGTIRFESPPHQRDIYVITSNSDYDDDYEEPRRGRQSSYQDYYPSRRLSMGPTQRSPSPMSESSSREEREKAPGVRNIRRLEYEIARNIKKAQERESKLSEAEDRLIQDRIELDARLAEAGMSHFVADEPGAVPSSGPHVAATTFALEEPMIRSATRRSSGSTASSVSLRPRPEAWSYALTEPLPAHIRVPRRRTSLANEMDGEAASPEQVTQLLSELTTGPIRGDRAARHEAASAPTAQAAAGSDQYDLAQETSAKHTDKYKPPEVE